MELVWITSKMVGDDLVKYKHIYWHMPPYMQAFNFGTQPPTPPTVGYLKPQIMGECPSLWTQGSDWAQSMKKMLLPVEWRYRRDIFKFQLRNFRTWRRWCVHSDAWVGEGHTICSQVNLWIQDPWILVFSVLPFMGPECLTNWNHWVLKWGSLS